MEMTTTTPPADDQHVQRHEIGDMLTYLPLHKVVICKTCEFAIQPNALSSHLQKHKVFRSQRRSLLDELSHLDLASPADVAVPPPSTPPIQGLTCFDGLKCQFGDCEYACTSDKRMWQHWSREHNCPNHKDVNARQVKLQTFFRGTQIRYFEVDGSKMDWSVHDATRQQRQQLLQQQQEAAFQYRHQTFAIMTPDSGVEDLSPNDFDVDFATPHMGFDAGSSPSNSIGEHQHHHHHGNHHNNNPFTSLDLKAMMYLHFFTVSSGTCLSLGMGSPTYWTHDLPRQAARYPYLMYTILGIAACHQACISTDFTEVQEHAQAARQYYSLSLPSFRQSMTQPNLENGSALAATARCLGIQDFVLSRIEHEQVCNVGYRYSPEEAIGLLVNLIALLRGSLDMLLDLQPYVAEESGVRLPPTDVEWMKTFAQKDGMGPDGVTPSLYLRQTKPRPVCIDPTTFECILLLPSRLASCGAITSEEDMQMTTRCCGVLLDAIEACNSEPIGLSSWGAWRSRQCWTQTVAVVEYFLPALRAGRPAALVVLAHFVALCILPTEVQYWFAINQTSRILDTCRMALSENPVLVALIDDLKAW